MSEPYRQITERQAAFEFAMQIVREMNPHDSRRFGPHLESWPQWAQHDVKIAVDRLLRFRALTFES